MLKNETWDLISDLVKEDDFHKEEHKLIYRTINDLQDAGKPVDVITVQEAIEGKMREGSAGQRAMVSDS